MLFSLEQNSDVKAVTPLIRRTFADCGVKETKDLQPALASCPRAIEEIAPGALIISEEYGVGRLKESSRRIDLLGVDKSANIVIIELKRTEEGGDAELQAIRYAAMMATVTFEDTVKIYEEYLKKQTAEQETKSNFDLMDEAKQKLLAHLDWDEPDEEKFGQQMKIVLASADFSPELTTSVIWLNDNGLDIRCVRLHPYQYGTSDSLSSESDEVLLDIQTIIPLPETSDYQVARRIKEKSEKRSREQKKTRPKYDLQISGQRFNGLDGRGIIRKLLEVAKNDESINRHEMQNILRGKHFGSEHLSSEGVKERMRNDELTTQPYDRFFHENHEIFHETDGTHIFSNQWTSEGAVNAANQFKEKFPSLNIEITRNVKS